MFPRSKKAIESRMSVSDFGHAIRQVTTHCSELASAEVHIVRVKNKGGFTA
jgi:hypothetical protein